MWDGVESELLSERASLLFSHSFPFVFAFLFIVNFPFRVLCIQRSVIHLISSVKDAKLTQVDASVGRKAKKLTWIEFQIIEFTLFSCGRVECAAEQRFKLLKDKVMKTWDWKQQHDKVKSTKRRKKKSDWIHFDRLSSVIMSVKESRITNVKLPLFMLELA